MKLAVGVALWMLVGATPDTHYFRYQREVTRSAGAKAGQACVALDPGVFAHATAQLADLRLYRDGVETPYVVRESESSPGGEKTIPLLNLGKRGGETTFDAEMPAGTYGDVELTVAAKDFMAAVTVTGSRASGGEATRLGVYTIFDLSRQKLGRSTVLHLPESDLRYLHFSVNSTTGGPIEPAAISGIWVERLPENSAKYAAVAETSRVWQKGRSTVLEFAVPAHVPVDRVTFVAGAPPAWFSREAKIRVDAAARPRDGGEPQPLLTFSGALLRIHGIRDGQKIDEERLSIDAPRPEFDIVTKWTIEVENGDDAPLAIQAVRLEMLMRSACFEAIAGGQYRLMYGDDALAAPQYDYAALFTPQPDVAIAVTGAEQANPAFRPRPDSRPFTERHPALLWVGLVAMVAVLGTIALRTRL